MTVEPARAATQETLELAIGGMTCGSCAARIERKLNRVDGVTAEVNFATERAHVTRSPDITVDELTAVVEKLGYTAEPIVPPLPSPTAEVPATTDTAVGAVEPDELADLRTRLLGGLALALPVVAMAMITGLQFRYWQWLSLTLAAPVVVWAAAPFHRAALRSIRHGSATMDTLVSLGVLAAFSWSLYTLFFGYAGYTGMRMAFTLRPIAGLGLHHIYLEVACALTVLILAGRYAEHHAKRQVRQALRSLLELGAKDVSVIREGHEVRVPIGSLAVGETFVARPGEKIATDGTIVDGSSTVDASLLTGESMPLEVGPGDDVVGATVNSSGHLLVRATRVGSETQLAQITRLVEQAQAGKAPIQRLADRVAAVFVPVVIGIAAAAAGFWLGNGGGAEQAFVAGVAVLVIACPCSLGLATPTALLAGTSRGAQLGILIKGPEILESTRRIDTVVLDKTGTVTTGTMQVAGVAAAAGEDAAEVLRLAGAVDALAEHPIGAAIAAAARAANSPLPPVTGFDSIRGLGVRGEVEGREVLVGRVRWLADSGMTLDDRLTGVRRSAENAGSTPVFVGWGSRIRGVITVSDTLKPSSPTAIQRLRALGLTPMLLSGDNEAATRAVGRAVGIDEVIAEVLPEDKVGVVRRLQSEGRVVAMVGDGVNDAAALAQADLGMAMGTGTDIAIQASDITLSRGDLLVAADAVRLSRRTLTIIKGNLFWAFAYNVAGLPLAAAGLLNPMIAGAAMACSSLFVLSNSLRLRGFRPRPE